MLFSVEHDLGDSITGYLVPDDFSSQSTLVVSDAGRELLRIKTTECRESLVAGRRHETGLCGFTIDQRILADIASLRNLTITDADSGVLIYCRRAEAGKAMRMFRLETHLLPLAQLDQPVRQLFQYSYLGLERWGRETIEQMFLLNHASSFYGSGRLYLRQFEHLIDPSKLKILILVQNPYYELAERMLLLSHVNQSNDKFFGLRDTLIYEEAIRYFGDIDLADDRSVRRGMRQMPKPVATLMSDPVVRSLATQTMEETIYGAHLASALEVLASCAVVGLRSHADLFTEAWAALLDIPVSAFPLIPQYKRVAELGEMLSKNGSATSLLSYDLELYSQIVASIQKALSDEHARA